MAAVNAAAHHRHAVGVAEVRAGHPTVVEAQRDEVLRARPLREPVRRGQLDEALFPGVVQQHQHAASRAGRGAVAERRVRAEQTDGAVGGRPRAGQISGHVEQTRERDECLRQCARRAFLHAQGHRPSGGLDGFREAVRVVQLPGVCLMQFRALHEGKPVGVR